MLPVLIDIYDKYFSYHLDNEALSKTLHSICAYHAPLQHGSEVSWALWLANKMNIKIPKPVGDVVAWLDDDIVAILGLDLYAQGLLETADLTTWQSHMNAGSLYEDHWLLAYEAHEQGWVPANRKSGYVADDAFFSILDAHRVRFYKSGLLNIEALSDYSDDDEEEELSDSEADNGSDGAPAR
jgi:hypothetical protein